MSKHISAFKTTKILAIGATVGSLLLLAGCSKLNKENYDKLKTGMEKSELEAIIGSADTCEEALAAESCVWGDDSKNIKVKFVAGKAVFFSNKGLN
ncbi:MAG: hypothetical protein MI976_03190 [Pseudomonadales bacterium]|nr:hypothetical protein [Pseudomonadales bacterium]